MKPGRVATPTCWIKHDCIAVRGIPTVLKQLGFLQKSKHWHVDTAKYDKDNNENIRFFIFNIISIRINCKTQERSTL